MHLDYHLLVSGQYFGATILRGPVEGREESIFTHEGRRAEVNQFHVELVVYYDVLVLYVAV